MWRVYPVAGYYDTHWLMGLWSIQGKVEGIMLTAARHWGNDSSDINDFLREPDRTPLYVGLLFNWGSVDGNYMFSLHFVGGFLFGECDRYK